MTRIHFNLRKLIWFELLSTLALSTGLGIALFASDLSSFWRERYSLDSGVIRQAFLDHRNEILNGNTAGFESTLATVANVYGIRFIELDYKVTGKVVHLTHDPADQFPVEREARRCRPPGIRHWLTGTSACFSTDFSWGRGSTEPLVAVRWWVVPEGIERQKRSAILLFSAALLLGFALSGLHWLLIRRVIVEPISQAVTRFDRWVRSEGGGGVPAENVRSILNTREISDLIRHFDQLLLMAQDYRKMRDAAIQLEAIDLIAKQVSHDLRSPLSALRVAVERLSRAPSPEARTLALSAFQRVNDILATLGGSRAVTRPTPAQATNWQLPPGPRVEDLLALVESIVAEQKLLLPSPLTRLELHFEEGHELFVRLNGVEMRRAFSNLLNNALEALPGSSGEVQVRLTAVEGEIQVTIQDNGVGIPSHVLQRLGQKGVTLGKENRPCSGSGLGVFQAKQAIEAAGGRLTFASESETGTLVTVHLPKAMPPPYWASEIPMSRTMVVVDDDMQMHALWRDKFRDMPCDLLCFLSASDFETWWQDSGRRIDSTTITFLLDFALGPHQPSGLDLVTRNSLPCECVLIVTAIANSSELQAQAERAGVRLMAKQSVPFKSVVVQREWLTLHCSM